MKINRWYASLLIGLLLMAGCGKPHDPETITPPDVSGGYNVISKFTTPGSAQDVIRKDTNVYIAQGEGGMIVINVKDPFEPEEVSISSDGVRGYSSRITYSDSVVYISAGTYGITVINVSDPYNPLVTVSNLNMKPARNVSIYGEYLVAAVGELGIKFAEISYPTQPDIRGGISTAGYAYGTAITPDSLHIAVANGEMGFSMYNISDFQNGFGDYPLTGWIDTPGYAEAVAISDSKPIAFVACGNSGLQVIDYTDTTNFKIVGSFSYAGYAKALIYKDDKVFLAARRGGLQIIDVSDVTRPALIGKVNMDGALGLDVTEYMGFDLIFVADEIEGLITVSNLPMIGK